MRGSSPLACLLGVSIFAAAALAEDEAFPEHYRELLQTKKATLKAVWGTSPVTLPADLADATNYPDLVSATFSPDGKLTASGHGNSSVQVRDAASGQLLHVLRGHEGVVNAVAYSPDSQFLVSGGWDRVLRLWGPKGEKLREIKTDKEIVSIAFSLDGKRLLAGLRDGEPSLWEVSSGKALGTFKKGNSGWAAAFTPDGKQVVTAGTNGDLALWDVSSREQVRVFRGHMYPTTVLVLSADGKRLLSAGAPDDGIKLWDVSTGKEVLTILTGGFTNAAAFTPDGKQAVAVTVGLVRSWDLADGKELHQATLTTTQGMALSPDRTRVVGEEQGGGLILREVDSGKTVPGWGGWRGSVTALAYAPDGRTALSTDAGGGLYHWDAASGQLLRALRASDNSVAAALSSDGKQALAPGPKGQLRLWDLAAGKELRTLKGHDRFITSIALSADGKQGLSASEDRTVRLWEIDTGKELHRLDMGPEPVNVVAFSPNGTQALTGGEDGTIRLWDPKTGREVRTLSGHRRGVTAVAFTADGKRILSGSRDRTLRLWDALTGKKIHILVGHDNWVRAVALSPDGTLALSASDDLSVKLWDLAEGEEVDHIDLGSSGDAPTGVAFAPDGRSFLVGTLDGAVLRFDLRR